MRTIDPPIDRWLVQRYGAACPLLLYLSYLPSTIINIPIVPTYLLQLSVIIPYFFFTFIVMNILFIDTFRYELLRKSKGKTPVKNIQNLFDSTALVNVVMPI